ncbi:MAG: squalene/phytoene synthase family protein [Longimicrobiales bacterium]|nr:squalene/phytoene synthase family protein [Longimicrobiales bacterium]
MISFGGFTTTPGALDVVGASRIVRIELEAAAEMLRADGLPSPTLKGKLLRPLVAYAFVQPEARDQLDSRFWFGALAIQMVHEASLLHDDIVDEAAVRRGQPTLHTEQGVGPALVQGDHLLTAAYSAALKTGSIDFLERFIHAVERTVAGEIRQARAVGATGDEVTYSEIISSKSGELLGASAYLAAALTGSGVQDARGEIGLRIGSLYQRVDDLLDYCSAGNSGKPPLQDYRQGKWTWILGEAQITDFGFPDERVQEAIFGHSGEGQSAAERAIGTLDGIRNQLLSEAVLLGACPRLMRDILNGWVSSTKSAVAAQRESNTKMAGASARAAPSVEAVVFETARQAGEASEWRAYFTQHARTFSLAARLFPAAPARQVEGLYAYCRVTDDLIDDPIVPASSDVLRERLDLWRALSRAAYEGDRIEIPVLDYVMPEAALASVDWLYPEALLDGVEMDLDECRYEDWPALERYTFGVAGSVGGWMTQLFGLRDPETLDEAHALGHALQLTNIARDVGEDLRRGRVYLPDALMSLHGFCAADLSTWQADGGPVPVHYRAAIEELLALADDYYQRAQPGIAKLPTFFRRPVAAAAAAYRGIGQEVRSNGHDNLNRRAHTKVGRKLLLGAQGILMARDSGRRSFFDSKEASRHE